ncbi:MAG TPA: hypothetical protein VJH03_26550 [Blastocatellia bacterium]|nr:hypothetical protein [Blastocatellia bacterium]
MKRPVSQLAVLMLIAQCFAPAYSQERLNLSGVLTMGYSKTQQTAQAVNPDVVTENQSREFGIGLDLNLGAYIIDPRFIKVSFESSFLRNKGAFDEFQTRYGITGKNVYVDFLPTSPYPFRFHYINQSSNYLQRPIASAATGRRSLGFNWALRLPKYPKLSVSYDSTSFDYSFTSGVMAKSHTRTFNAGVSGSYRGWDFTSGYDNQTTTDGRLQLGTYQNLWRLDARKPVSKKSNLYVGTFYQGLRFSSEVTGLRQRLSFFDIHSEFSTQHTNKLSSRFAHQFYYNTSTQETDQQGVRPEAGAVAAPAVPALRPTRTTTQFNVVDGLVAYRVRSEVTVSGTLSTRLTNAPNESTEAATRFFDLGGTITWNRRIAFAETRAAYSQGLEYAGSNMGSSRRTEHHSLAAGLSLGNRKRALVTADFNLSYRPDIFQAGGFFSQKYFNAGVESEALRALRLSASVGKNEVEYLTFNGREHLRRTSYSAGVDHRRFTLVFSRNSNAGLRDVFAIPVPLEPNRIFRVLPVGSLISNPLLNTSAFNTFALLRVRPRRNLDLEARYYQDRALFVTTNNVFVKQWDVIATYKLGKFTFYGGALFYKQTTEGLLSRDRTYYFVRVTRPFKVL